MKARTTVGNQFTHMLFGHHQASDLHNFLRFIRDHKELSTDKIILALKQFIIEGNGVNEYDPSGFTPLACAACHNYKVNLNVLTFLLDQNADPNKPYGTNIKNEPDCYVIVGLLQLYLSDGFGPYSSEETIKEYLDEIEPSILAAIRLLIDRGADLMLMVDPADYILHLQHGNKMTILEYIKFEQERWTHNPKIVAELGKIIEYYDMRKPIQQSTCAVS